MVTIHIADSKTDEIIDFIPEDHFWNDLRKRELAGNRDTFDFETFATESYSGALEKRNRIIIPNRHGMGYAEFIIGEAAQILDDTGLHYKSAYTSASYLELRKQKLIPAQTITGYSPLQHMELALSGTEWQVGTVEYGENHTTVLTTYMDAYSYLLNIASWSGMELRFRVESNGYKITGRYVDLIDRAGEWRGHEAVLGQNLLSIERRRKYHDIVTALIGLGPENEDGSARTESYAESNVALQRWGRNGQHLIEVFEPQSEDQNMSQAKLDELTQEELNRRISHQSEYSATIHTLAEVMGVDPMDLQFGDYIRLKDEEFNPPLYLEARIHTMEESIKAYGDSQVTLGDYTEFTEDEVKSILKRLQKQLADKVSDAEMVTAIQDSGFVPKYQQNTAPTDLDALWVDTTNRPYITKVYVDAVSGWVPIMPSTAAEIGADPAGSADAALAAAREDITETNNSLTGLRNEYDAFVADGYISKAEALSIQRHLQSLDAEKSDIDSDYTATYNNARLLNKTPLTNAKNAYDTAHTNLKNAINTAVADNNITLAERDDVNAKFTAYGVALGDYATARADATQEINVTESKAQVDAIEIGGRNLLRDTKAFGPAWDEVYNAPVIDPAMTYRGLTPYRAEAAWAYMGQRFTFEEGKTYTITAFIRTNTAGLNPGMYIFDEALMYGTMVANTWLRFEKTVTIGSPTSLYKPGEKIVRLETGDTSATQHLWIAGFMIEEGNKASDHVEAPEDVLAHAEAKALEAKAAAEEYAAAEAEYARMEAVAYADGILTDEEQARIQDASNKLAEAKAHADQAAADAVAAIDNSHLATKEELQDQKNQIDEQLSTKGGANLLRNSIGYAGLDFWSNTTSNHTITTAMNTALTTLGFGSGFYFPPDGLGKGMLQSVNVVAGSTYTLGWYIQRMAAGDFTIEVIENSVVIASSADASAVGGGYSGNFLSFTPTTSSVSIRFTAAGTAEITLTGLMLGLGELPSQWTLASGELYNAYVRADEKGINVLGLDADGNVERKTIMSPEEFAGYYDDNRDGNFERVFYLNQDETVTKKLRAKEEMTMGTIKIVRVDSTNNRGWAFVPIIADET